MGFNIAIDGPAGAGKSTIARRVAEKLSFQYVDTGAMYRSIAWYMLKNGIRPEDEEGLTDACRRIKLDVRYVDGSQRMILDGEDITEKLRTEAVGNMASAAGAMACVRERLLNLQRDLAARADVIMDGRDIGTNILPDAQLKIYLTASVETRARRRYLEQTEKGEACNMQQVSEDLRQRDARDMGREIAPLCQAEDAVLVDSSDMTIDEVTERIISLYQSRKGEAV